MKNVRSKSIKSFRLTLASLLAFFVFVVGSFFFISPFEKKTASAAGEVTIEEQTIEIPLSMFPATMNVAGSVLYLFLSDTIYITQRFVVDYSYELEPFRSGTLTISSQSKGELFNIIYSTPDALNSKMVDESITTTINYVSSGMGFIQNQSVFLDLSSSGLLWSSLFNIGLLDNTICISGVSDEGRGTFQLSLSFVSSMVSFYTTPNVYTATDPFVIYSPFKQNGGYNEGYDVGYESGYKNGNADGYGEGYRAAYDIGYDNGFDAGHDEGYNVGLTVGKNSITGDALGTSIKSFVFSLFDAPVSTFMSVFNFEYDGFNIGALVSFLFSLAIVSAVLKVIL